MITKITIDYNLSSFAIDEGGVCLMRGDSFYLTLAVNRVFETFEVGIEPPRAGRRESVEPMDLSRGSLYAVIKAKRDDPDEAALLLQRCQDGVGEIQIGGEQKNRLQLSLPPKDPLIPIDFEGEDVHLELVAHIPFADGERRATLLSQSLRVGGGIFNTDWEMQDVARDTAE